MNRAKLGWGDRFFFGLCRICGLSIGVIIVALLVVLTFDAWPVLNSLTEVGFFTSDVWDPNPDPPELGARAFIFGTLVTSTIAMFLAVPFGVATAAYLSEIAPEPVRRVGSFFIELLAAIPSVVYGFWGVQFLAPVLQWLFMQLTGKNTSGQGLLASGLILAIMVVPYITAISFDVCRSVPRSQREAALALGATRWHTIWSVVLPYARPGILAACFLALGRALGETMAVTMLIGNQNVIDLSLTALGNSIASVIANELNEALDEKHTAALIALGLVLFLITTATNVIARYLIAVLSSPPSKRAAADDPAASRFEVNQLDNVLLRESKVTPEPKALARARRHARRVDALMTWVLRSSLVGTLAPLFLILGYITVRGFSALDVNFFTQTPAPPGESGGGLGHALLGSAILVALASALAIPLGVLTAVYLSESRANYFNGLVRFLSELLAGVPSIVVGVFCYAILVKTMGTFSGWAGAVALAIMMLPVVVRTTEESLRLVPSSIRQASLALGATRWQTTLYVVVPAATSAIVTGILLAVGRIAGETAPLLLTAFGSVTWSSNPSEPMPFLPKYIYEYSGSPFPEQQRQAWAAALVLLSVVMILNFGIRFLAGKRMVAASRGD